MTPVVEGNLWWNDREREVPGIGRLAAGMLLAAATTVPGQPASAAGETRITSCPLTLSTPGVYVLTRNLTCPAPAFTVTADNVRIRFMNRRITATAPGDQSQGGVQATGVSGLMLTSGTIEGYYHAILIEDTQRASIEAMTLKDSVATGVRALRSSGLRLERNDVSENSDGFALYGCEECQVRGNRSVRNRNDGLELGTSGQGVTKSTFERNTFSNNGANGINIQGGGAQDNQISRNTIRDNGEEGLYVGPDEQDNRLTRNIVRGNGGPDLVDRNLTVFDPPRCVNIWQRNNFVTDNEGDGPGAGCIR